MSSYICQDCGENYEDWTLLPHKLFNSVASGGNGLICFPCFIKRTPTLKEARIDELERLPKVKLDMPFKHMSGRYREHARFTIRYVANRLKELNLMQGSKYE